MGTVNASNYANLFLGFWENEITEDFNLYTIKKCFEGEIDHILIFGKEEKHHFDEFVQTINNDNIGINSQLKFMKKKYVFLM